MEHGADSLRRKRIIQEQEGFGSWLFKFVFWWDRRRDWMERLVKSWWSRLDSSMGFFAVRVLRCNGVFRWKWMDNSLKRWIILRWEVVENSSARWIILRWKMTVNSWKRCIIPRWKDIDLGLWFFGNRWEAFASACAQSLIVVFSLIEKWILRSMIKFGEQRWRIAIYFLISWIVFWSIAEGF